MTKPTTIDLGKYSIFGIAFKDFIYLISLVVAFGGWIRSETIQKERFNTKIEELSKKIDQTQQEIKKINDIFIDQQILNGKIIQYMQMK